MKYQYLHPRDQIVMLMDRIYEYGMTTTSGGNLSLIDEDGNIWISPAGVDKASLRPDDIVCVKADGTIVGKHKPSSEYPFHKAIYEARPDILAIVHAHPTALVSFSIVRQLPDTRIIPQAREVCGRVGIAPYALPGSSRLGQNIAAKFGEGLDCVLLENHGVVCSGRSLLEAFQRFETLDFCARLILKAASLGSYHVLADNQIDCLNQAKNFLPEFDPERRSNDEKELRRTICDIVHRAYEQQIMTSTEGTLSARLGEGDFVITPVGADRKYLDVADIVRVEDGRRERGKLPSRSVALHQAIYAAHPWVGAIISAQAPNSTAFGVSDRTFDTRTIPESYILLRDIPKLPFGQQYTDEAGLAQRLSPSRPVLLLSNDAILAVGRTVLEAYDRLEVAEFTARSLISAIPLGGLVAIDEPKIDELIEAFRLPTGEAAVKS